MIDLKKEIAHQISEVIKINIDELETYIEKPKESSMGDYAFPCFKLAKTLKKAPPIIANEIKEKLNLSENIEKIEVVGGYLNFYIKKYNLVKEVLKNIENEKENYGKSEIGKGKNILVEYSSPNIAKEFHIGHLRTTVIGAALYNIYKYLGYNTTSINHLGDYGTQFGKLIESYKRWGNDEKINKDPINELTKLYIDINNLCKEDEKVLEACRENFKKLEEGDEYCTKLWERFKELSLKEFNKTYELLGIKFDSLKGEAFYSDKQKEIIELLEKSGKLIESQGAKIIDLEDKGMAPCIIQKSDGSSIYATRDLAAILYRVREYDFDKCLYVVAYEQNLHFRQIFEVAKLLGLDKKYTDGLIHVAYGMTRLPTGKMSTRLGNVIKVNDLLNEAIERVKKVIDEKNPNMENKDENAKKIGIGAVIFNNLCNNIIKDQVFDWNTILNFQGETGPYVQYIYVRTKSVIEKAGYLPKFEDIEFNNLTDKYSFEIIKLIYSFEDTLKQVTDKNDPSILSRFLIDLSKAYSVFYNENKILCEDKKIQDARIYLSNATGNILKIGSSLLGIEMPDKM